jgi:signal transduction histidine kinase/CheY-like chemotaxis protein/HPt (histidine-containing phosphotransfer) domain-containing protein
MSAPETSRRAHGAVPSPHLRLQRGRIGGIRGQVARLLMVLGLLLALLVVLTALQIRGSDHENKVESERVTQLELADSMRQSSNDLTRMVQLYVSTGQTRYRTYYDQILAIRAGTAPRPLDYTNSFWDEVLAHGPSSVRYGPPQSLEDQMRAAHFTPDEFAALDASLTASNQLARLELDVMGEVAPRIAEGVNAHYQADVASQYDRLVDQHYLDQKGTIMSAVERFNDLVNAHTLAAVRTAQDDNRRLFFLQFAVLAAGLVVGLAALRRTRRVLLGPLSSLVGVTREVADGDYAQRATIRSVTELEGLAGALNDMALAIESDIARRQAAERQAVEARCSAEQASRAKSTFLASMSHEIRTPMIGVTGMLEILEQTPLTEEQQQMIVVAQTSAQTMLQLIGDILDLSKIEAGRLDLSCQPFRVRALVEGVVRAFSPGASSKGLQLTWDADETLAEAHEGDSLRLRQILGNIVSNAVKFTDEGGIHVSARADAPRCGVQRVELVVRDTGNGVPAAEMAHLFEEFRQVDATGDERWAGSGLGLVICRQLARLMGGDVTMDSRLDTGTTVTLSVELPVADPAAVVEPAGRRSGGARVRLMSRREAEREGAVLLLVEDHPVNRQVLTGQLALLGFHVDVATDGAEALDCFRGGSYGAVLTDLNMAGLSGYELTAAIRRFEETTGAARTPIVALTANALQGEADRCLAGGMDDVAIKPVTIPALRAKLRRWLGHLPWDEDPAGPTTATSAKPDLIDPSVLSAVADGDPHLVAAIVADFAVSVRADIDAIGSGSETGDLAAVGRHAHRLRGASLVVGATALADLASRIETSCRDAVPPGGLVQELITLGSRFDEVRSG